MDVSKNRDTPKWMVKIMENPIKMDDLGVPLFSETPLFFSDSRRHLFSDFSRGYPPWCRILLFGGAGCWFNARCPAGLNGETRAPSRILNEWSEVIITPVNGRNIIWATWVK